MNTGVQLASQALTQIFELVSDNSFYSDTFQPGEVIQF